MAMKPSGALLRYQEDFISLDMPIVAAVKFLQPTDLDKFEEKMSKVHRRIVCHNQLNHLYLFVIFTDLDMA